MNLDSDSEPIPNDPKKITREYFESHVEARDGVMKAYHAYHVTHFGVHPQAHNFPGVLRVSKCVWCGRSREMVRHDDLPAECMDRPTNVNLDVKEIILGEEELALELRASASKMVPKLLERMGGLSGESLSVLHHTHGYDPETVASVISEPDKITDKMMDIYSDKMEVARERSRLCRVKDIVMAENL